MLIILIAYHLVSTKKEKNSIEQILNDKCLEHFLNSIIKFPIFIKVFSKLELDNLIKYSEIWPSALGI